MSQENVDRTADFIAAYNRRDFDAAVELFHPEVEWVLPASRRPTPAHFTTWDQALAAAGVRQ
jgi:ketosteroid isomerase-like protein